MSICVVDASVAAKWFVEEDHSDEASRLLSAPFELHAPDLLLLEMDSMLCKWVRRGLVTGAEAALTRQTIRQVPINLHSTATLQDAAFPMAVKTGAGMYDCLYVALAMALDAQAFTADRRFCDILAGGPYGGYVRWIGRRDSSA